MQVNSVNNVAFGGLFSAMKARRVAKQAKKLAEETASKGIEDLWIRALLNLQKRAVSYSQLGKGSDGLIFDINTGKNFIGKYIVPGYGAQIVYRVKDGKIWSIPRRLQ